MDGWGPVPGERAAVPGGVIAVVRAATAEQARTIVRGLIRAAVPAIELTMTVPDAVALIGEFAGSGSASGAGTVPGAHAVCLGGALIDREAADRKSVV